MSNADNMNNWVLIQSGVRDTERLIGQKQYNLAMIKSRQTLEFMVKCLITGNGLPEGDLIDMIDSLYSNKIISKTTCEHYHKIRMIGNKASHENDNNAYNANTSYHVLSQEIYTFASDYSPKRQSRAKKPLKRTPSESSESRKPASGRTVKRARQISPAYSLIDLMKLVIPVLIIIILIFLIKVFKPDTPKETLPAETSTEQVSTEALQTTEASTEALIYRTNSALNVRSAPSRDGDKLATLAAGTVVDYVGPYDSEWAIINYDGGQAYVASAYLTTE